MQNIEVLIVEDELIVAEEIKEILLKNGYQIYGQFDDSVECLEKIKSSKPDIALLDINIKGDLDGIELAQKIKELHSIPIVFLTAYSDDHFLKRAKNVEPAAYLTKPFKERDVTASIEIAVSNHLKDTNEEVNQNNYFLFNTEWLFIKEGSRFKKMSYMDIKYIEATGSYSNIVCTDKIITVAVNLKYIAGKIKSPKFLRVHRSFIVNLSFIDSFEGNTIYLGKEKIPISQNYKENFLASLNIL